MSVRLPASFEASIDSVTQTAEQEADHLGLAGKIGAIAAGPILGLAPAQKQIQLWKGNETAAAYMSTTSRIHNGVWGLYAIASLGARAFGADLDPTPVNLLTWVGLGVAADALLREALFAARYYFNHPFVTPYDPIGEPILELLCFHNEVPLH